MNVVDSSAWLEYFANGPNARAFAPAVDDTKNLVVPTVCIYEVFKRTLMQRDRRTALEVVAAMRQGQVAELTDTIAISAALISTKLKLPLADSVILATARAYNATVWTQDEDFKALPDAKYFPKR